MVSEFEECFPEEVDSPEMELIMKVVEELEMVVEQGAEFLPVFPPPQAPGVRERESFVPRSLHASLQNGFNNYNKVYQFRCQPISAHWGPSICIWPGFYFRPVRHWFCG